ncbi:putative leucine-rich repeat-containing protein DDB_G0290503 [Antennarius striatus]|uniref:putative leucine-rich repeat-containing protein DDB_G0290503 n=1 Tax=Antennarius striatus TaxID=241820 RepID=UPI0035AED5CB
MLHYGSGQTISTTTTVDSPESLRERRIKHLRLTLHAGDNGSKEQRTAKSGTAEKEKDDRTWRKKNGLIQRERPAGRESPQQHHGDMTNGAPETSVQKHGPRVYGVVQRVGADKQQEVMARQWTVSHLQEEMKYIREVRDSLEKVRERMYGQFGGMQQSMNKLTQEIREANTHRRSLESEVMVRTSAMESFDQMNSSLIVANISLQKSLLENCQTGVERREEVKRMRSNLEKAQQKLTDKESELSAAQIENQTLRLKVEASREAQTQALQELSAKLQKEYEEKLQEEQQRHREEIENLQVQLDEYIRRLEEAEKNIRIAEATIEERDQKIIEVERLLDCMGKEKSHFQTKLEDCEKRLRLLEQSDVTDATVIKRTKELKSESVDLRERIKHLNDMVFCQQRKIKGMIEEVECLRGQVAQKDLFISELLDRIAIVECENNELEDKLKYFMSTQNKPRENVKTREFGVGCDLLPRPEVKRIDDEAPILHEPSHLHPMQQPPSADSLSPEKPPSLAQPPSLTSPLSSVQPSSPIQMPSVLSSGYPFITLTSSIQTRTYSPKNLPPSRLEASLLRYSPIEYSRMLDSSPSVSVGLSSYSHTSESESNSESPASSVQSGIDEVDAETKTEIQSSPEESTSSPSSEQPKPKGSRIYTPFMKLLEMTQKTRAAGATCLRLRAMSSSWTERQGEVGNLGEKSHEELRELLQRQEKILNNRRLVQTLPDKGKKIKEFVEKVQLAIKLHNEEERRQSLVSSAKTELQSKYQQAFTNRRPEIPDTPAASHQSVQTQAASHNVMQGKKTSPASDAVQENLSLDKEHGQLVSTVDPGETMETAAAGASLNSNETKEADLVEALERVSMSETSPGFSNKSKDPSSSTRRDNYFLRKDILKKPHYVTLLEKTETTPAKQKFKTNQLPHSGDTPPSGSLSPRQGSLQLSAQARRERDRKHLDDVTAARQPPLHYSPAQLLSLEESAVLLQEQTKRQHELQAKLAAQKLSEGLRVSMESYTPDGGPTASYREVHDAGAQLSSDDD